MRIEYGDIFTDYRIGHVVDVLRDMENGSVNMAVTSPPYWGLRNYGCPPAVWDGDEDCVHEWSEQPMKLNRDNRNFQTGTQEEVLSNPTGTTHIMSRTDSIMGFCQKCGAWKGQLGLEPDFNLYIKHLCDIFNGVKRVLRDDGTCWVNLGDTYGSGTGQGGTLLGRDKKDENKVWGSKPIQGFQKSLVMIPFRFAIEMVNRGWILRNTLIWHKPNCMPSSAKDRFTVDFEYLFFFSKSRKYYFEQQYDPQSDWKGQSGKKNYHLGEGRSDYANQSMNSGGVNPQGRNKRCVWSICPQPYPEAHFAVFPAELIETPIKAGCPLHGIVLDPFVGSGTTLQVCKRLNRSSIGIDIQDNYRELIENRIRAKDTSIEQFF